MGLSWSEIENEDDNMLIKLQDPKLREEFLDDLESLRSQIEDIVAYHVGGQGQYTVAELRRDLPDYLRVLDLILSKNPPINNVMNQDHLASYYQQRVFALGTPLHEATEKGRLDIVKILAEKGTNPLMRDSCGDIPLQRAERMQRQSVIDY
ncbi:hypothetical protein DV736_g2042, partial [Chaetothyriales sp. CBS 134916]